MSTNSFLQPRILRPIFFLSLWVGSCIILGATLGIFSDSSLPILIVLAITGFLVFMVMDLALYAMLICFPFSFRYILPAQTEVQTPTEPLLGMLIFAFFIKRILDGAIKIERSDQKRDFFPFGIPVLFYAFVTLISTFNAPDLYVSAKGAIRAITYMMLTFLVYEVVQDRRELRRLFVATIPSAVIAVVWTSIVLIYQIDQWRWTSAYYGAPFTNYMAYGSFTAVFLFIILSRLLSDSTLYDRVLWTGLLGIFGGGLILCFSRGVWMSVIMAFGFLFMQLGKGEQHKKILFGASVGILILVIFSFPGLSNLLIDRISTIFSFQFASNRSRLLRWGQAFLMFLQNPIIGNGYGAFAMIYEQNVALVGTYTAKFQLGAHSEYLQVLAELGIIGFAIWLWVVIAFFRYGLRALQHIDDGFYHSLIVGLMTAEFSMLVLFAVFSMPSGDELAVPFWLIYGLLPAVVKMAKQPAME